MSKLTDGKWRELFDAARRQGWAITRTGREHFRLAPPDASLGLVFVSCTPGDRRAYDNCRARMRRAGLVLP